MKKAFMKLFLAALLLAPSLVAAQGFYSGKTIRVIVGGSPGGGSSSTTTATFDMNSRRSRGSDSIAPSTRSSNSSTVTVWPMGRGSRPSKRWKNDRQRKKKERDRRRAAEKKAK